MDFVSPVEVDFLIQSLRRQRIQDLVKELWLDQHATVIKLNQQCVLEARTEGREELTRDLIVQHGKTKIIVQDLFSVFVWRKNILTKLEKRDSILVYSIGYHELVLVNLLELILYNGNGCESLDDQALDLVDYAVQSVTQLIGLLHSGYLEEGHEGSAAEDSEYKLAIHSVSIIYYLIDKVDSLPLSVSSRLIRFHDTPCLLSEVLHCRPWQRRSATGGFEKFAEGKWTKVFADDLMKVSKVEAQSWFALRQLLFNQRAMQNYDWNDFRCGQISKCLGLINDVLLDQLTPLVQLKQYLATMTIQKPSNIGGSGSSKKATFLLEEIPELQSDFLKEISDFGEERLIQMHSQLFFNANVSGVAKKLNEAYNVERILELQGDDEVEIKPGPFNKCGQCIKSAEKKCSRCELVFYCSRDCQVQHWATHKSFCKSNAK